MKLSEWARAHNLSYQTVWRWFKNGTLPVKAKQMPSGQIIIDDEEYDEESCDNVIEKEITISQADKEMFKAIMKEAQTDKDYKIITHGNVIIEKNYAEEVSKKLDILLNEIISMKKELAICKAIKNCEKEEFKVLQEEITSSLTDTACGIALEKMAEEKKIKSIELSEKLVQEMKDKQKELTKRLTTEDVNTKIGFKRAKLETVASLIKACKELIAIEDKKDNDFCPTIIKNILDKIEDFVHNNKPITDEEKQMFEQMKQWLSNKQIKLFTKIAYSIIEKSYNEYSKEDVANKLEDCIISLRQYKDNMTNEQYQTLQDICSIQELYKKYSLATKEQTREFFESIAPNELIDNPSKLSMMILAIKEMHNYIGTFDCLERNADILQIKATFNEQLNILKAFMLNPNDGQKDPKIISHIDDLYVEIILNICHESYYLSEFFIDEALRNKLIEISKLNDAVKEELVKSRPVNFGL